MIKYCTNNYLREGNIFFNSYTLNHSRYTINYYTFVHYFERLLSLPTKGREEGVRELSWNARDDYVQCSCLLLFFMSYLVSARISRKYWGLGYILVIVFTTILISISVASYLLVGSYTIEFTNFPENTSTISLLIKETGKPSGRCFVTLFKINESNKNLFEEKDKIILTSRKNSSEKGHMIGKKTMAFIFSL